jgi:hypothetical protein
VFARKAIVVVIIYMVGVIRNFYSDLIHVDAVQGFPFALAPIQAPERRWS